jgi:hypothetical protein
MQENKTKDLALIKIQSKIWEQKRYIRELESNIEKDETVDYETRELNFNNLITQLEVYEYIKKAIQNYD